MTKDLITLNDKSKRYDIRRKQKYKIQFANTDRYRKSPVIHMQRLLNAENNSMMSSLHPTG